jgi:outer membrane protein insertion porin family
MTLCRVLLAGAVLATAPPGSSAQTPPVQQPASPPVVVQQLQLQGIQELSRKAAVEALDLRIGEPLADSPDQLAAALERKYRDEGYSFARVRADFDPASGTLTVDIDEGLIGEVEFRGLDEARARTLAADFALKGGDTFNRDRAGEALDALLRPSRGALRPGRSRGEGPGAFDLVDDNGRRRLVVRVVDRAADFRLTPNFGEREDWFTSVDGFVPSLGFGGAVFDHKLFNHAYVAGHLSYKMAPGRAGYALGFERPLFNAPKLYAGAELYDLTATDDRWQMSGTEASIDAFAARRSFRDYHRRRGGQVHAALRLERRFEVQFAWRGERHSNLDVDSDFSLWNRDESFRPNRPAAEGRLHSMVFAASVDSLGFERESLAATYRRHQLDMPFGDRLPAYDRDDPAQVWRLDWTTEVASPGTLGGDFDFTRHVASGRLRRQLSRREEVRLRGIAGWTDGAPPAQRLFAAGGIGSVHGYVFKEAIGTRLALINAEYAIGRLNSLHLLTFFDAARVSTEGAAQPVWLKGAGFGLGLTREIRVDFGYKLSDIPGSVQVLLRIDRTF